MKHVDTIIMVEDIERTKEFYMTNFELEIFHDWGAMIIFKNRLAFHQADKIHPQEQISEFLRYKDTGCGNIIIYIETDDIESALKRVRENNITLIHGIVKFPWNEDRIIRIKDPDGYIVEIGQLG